MAAFRCSRSATRFLPESNAACWYLAEGSALIPTDRFDRADMLRWMFFEQYNHEPNIATLRFWLAFIGEANFSESPARSDCRPSARPGEAALKLMDQHLADRDFMAGGSITLADIALYAYTHVCEAAGFRLSDYPHIGRWLDRVAGQPGYLAMN